MTDTSLYSLVQPPEFGDVVRQHRADKQNDELFRQKRAANRRTLNPHKAMLAFTNLESMVGLLDDGNTKEAGLLLMETRDLLDKAGISTDELDRLGAGMAKNPEQASDFISNNYLQSIRTVMPDIARQVTDTDGNPMFEEMRTGERTPYRPGMETLTGSQVIDGQVIQGSPESGYTASQIQGFTPKQDDKKWDLVYVQDESGNTTTALWDGQKSFMDTEGQPIDVSRESTIYKASSLSGAAEELGLGDTEARQLNDSQVSTMNTIDMIGEVRGMLRENPDLNTLAASGARLLNTVRTEAQAFGRLIGEEVDEKIFEPETYEGSFPEFARNSEQLQAALIGLAYSTATAREGGRLSDQDVERALVQLGANSGDPVAFMRILGDGARRMDREFRNNYRVRTGKEFDGDLGLDAVISGPASVNLDDMSDEEFMAFLEGGS